MKSGAKLTAANTCAVSPAGRYNYVHQQLELTMPSLDLLSITDAASRLQPFLGKLNASYWLTDLRRACQYYRRRVFTPALLGQT